MAVGLAVKPACYGQYRSVVSKMQAKADAMLQLDPAVLDGLLDVEGLRLRIMALSAQGANQALACELRDLVLEVQSRLRFVALSQSASDYRAWVKEQLDDHHARALYAWTSMRAPSSSTLRRWQSCAGSAWLAIWAPAPGPPPGLAQPAGGLLRAEGGHGSPHLPHEPGHGRPTDHTISSKIRDAYCRADTVSSEISNAYRGVHTVSSEISHAYGDRATNMVKEAVLDLRERGP